MTFHSDLKRITNSNLIFCMVTKNDFCFIYANKLRLIFNRECFKCIFIVYKISAESADNTVCRYLLHEQIEFTFKTK